MALHDLLCASRMICMRVQRFECMLASGDHSIFDIIRLNDQCFCCGGRHVHAYVQARRHHDACACMPYIATSGKPGAG